MKALKEELKTHKEELKALKEKLEFVKKSRDKALDRSTVLKKLVDIFETHAAIYKTSFKWRSGELVDAELRLQTTRAENNVLFQEKQMAQRFELEQWTRAENAENMVEWLREQLTTERARICEFELEHGVTIV